MYRHSSTAIRAVLFLALSAFGFSQTFRGGISGNVADSSGAAIPAAVVKATNPATGLVRSTVSSDSGDFAIPDLPVGMYQIVATKDGFQSQQMSQVEVAVSKISNVTFKLGVAQQTTLVEVAAQSVQIETTSTALVGVVNTRTVADLPMNGRDFKQMLKLAPGVGVGTTPSVNGMRTSGNNFQIDGADNNDAFHNTSAVNQGGVSGIAGTLLPVEAIDQFAIQTNAGADMGRNGGASVNLVIKSGTNDVHGSLYYFNRNEYFAALSPFQAPGSKARVIRNNQYGFSLGGPIVKNRTFFFMTGEAQKAIAANSTLTTTPSAAWVSQAQAVLARYGVATNPVSTNLLSFYPSRTRTVPAISNNFLSTDQNDYDSYNGIIKLDQVLGSKHNLSARYFGGTGKQVADVGVPLREFFQVAPSRMHNMSVVLTSALTPRLTNQITLGVNYFLQVFNDLDTGYDPIAAGLNTGVTEATLRGSPTLRVSGFAGVSATQPLGRIDTTGHFVDNLSYVLGRHQMKFGAEYRRAQLDVFYDTNKRGSFTFDGSAGPWRSDASVSTSLRALSDFLAGYPATSSGALIARGQLQRLYHQNSLDWWAHDNWQVTQKLNFNFGVRYTYHGVLGDDKNSVANFIPSRGFVTPGKDIDTLYPKDWNNFAPRFGFAYTPKRNGGTVVRGSYGIFYDVPPLNFFVANTGLPNGGAAGINANPGGPSPVYSISLGNTINTTTNLPNLVLQPGVPIFGTTDPRPPFGVFAVSQDYRTPYVQNFNLNVQQQVSKSGVLQVGYVGSLGRKLSLLRNINAALPGSAPLQERRPYYSQYPTLAAINELESIGTSSYNSLQASYRLNLWKGLTANANYTWSHAIDYGSNVRNAIPANSYDLSREKGNANFDVRHVFTSFVSYDVPTLTQRWRRVTGGWQVNSLMTFHSGQPFDILAGTNISGSGDNRDRVDLVGDPYANLQPTGSTSVRYFNPAAFARPAAGTFGNLGRNALTGPGFGAVDFSVFKNTPITERIRTQFRAEIFNIFNRANYANPGATLSSSTAFGLITNTINGGSAPGLGFGEPRNVQFALKIIF